MGKKERNKEKKTSYHSPSWNLLATVVTAKILCIFSIYVTCIHSFNSHNNPVR